MWGCSWSGAQLSDVPMTTPCHRTDNADNDSVYIRWIFYVSSRYSAVLFTLISPSSFLPLNQSMWPFITIRPLNLDFQGTRYVLVDALIMFKPLHLRSNMLGSNHSLHIPLIRRKLQPEIFIPLLFFRKSFCRTVPTLEQWFSFFFFFFA